MIYREDYDNAEDYVQAVIRSRRRRIHLTVILIIAAAVCTVLFLYEYFKVKTVIVTGNTRYTDEEITNLVETGPLGDNSLYLSLRYRNQKVTNVPFVESMDVEVLSHNSIRITVYEMSLAGYVTYLGRCMYFSRDGTVVESSTEKLSGIPEVTGLSFDHIVMYEKLPVKDDSVFEEILNVTQILSGYSLEADRIYFDGSGDMDIWFGDVRASLGGMDYINEKIASLAQILPNLEGRHGTLDLSQYTPETDYVTFIIRHDGKSREEIAAEENVQKEEATVPVVKPKEESSESSSAESSAGNSQEASSAASTFIEKIPVQSAGSTEDPESPE